MDISEASKNLPKEKKEKIDALVVETMRQMESNNRMISSLLDEAEKEVKSANTSLDQIISQTERFKNYSTKDEEDDDEDSSSQQSSEPPTQPILARTRELIHENVEKLTKEREKTPEESVLDELEGIMLEGSKVARKKLSKQVKRTFGPSKVTDLAFTLSRGAYEIGKKIGACEESEVVELGFELHDARKTLVKEAQSLIEKPGETTRKYLANILDEQS